MKKEKPFLEITNKDIYDKIMQLQEIHERQHKEIIERQDRTNGKVKRSLLIAGAALGLTLLVVGWFIQHLLNSIPR